MHIQSDDYRGEPIIALKIHICWVNNDSSGARFGTLFRCYIYFKLCCISINFNGSSHLLRGCMQHATE